MKNKMRINEIFYSLQGEGRHAGRAAIFIRFAGCNLKCPFCDTNHQPYTEISEDEVIKKIHLYPCHLVVLTGGEPALQLTSDFIESLHQEGYYICIETNGTKPIPKNIDWVTLSPKNEYVGEKAIPVIKECDELKVIFKKEPVFNILKYGIHAKYYYLQPCDTGNQEQNKKIISDCVGYIKEHPLWSLSLQTQKILQIQ